MRQIHPRSRSAFGQISCQPSRRNGPAPVVKFVKQFSLDSIPCRFIASLEDSKRDHLRGAGNQEYEFTNHERWFSSDSSWILRNCPRSARTLWRRPPHYASGGSGDRCRHASAGSRCHAHGDAWQPGRSRTRGQRPLSSGGQ